MWSVTQLARKFGLSRTTLLYYESVGLLDRPRRTPGNYRQYGEKDAARLAEVLAYRNAGIPLRDVRTILRRAGGDASVVLKRRLLQIDREVARLRDHQRLVLRLLGTTAKLGKERAMTKDKWVAIMKAAGFTDGDMKRWHSEFEKGAPAEHQEFLEFLHIAPEEIRTIRAWSAGR